MPKSPAYRPLPGAVPLLLTPWLGCLGLAVYAMLALPPPETLLSRKAHEPIPAAPVVAPPRPAPGPAAITAPVPEVPVKAFSAGAEAELALATPQEGQDFVAGSGGPGIVFSWRGPDLTRRPGFTYIVDVSRERDFRVLQGRLTTARGSISDKGLKLSPGEYFWRVRLVGDRGATVETSGTSRFVFRPRPLPPPPKSQIRIGGPR